MLGVISTLLLICATTIVVTAQQQNTGPCSGGGKYETATPGVCAVCPAGHFCPPNTYITYLTLGSIAICPPGTYQPLQGQLACLTCPANTKCVGLGNVDFTQCPDGMTSPEGSESCSTCDEDHYDSGGGICTPKTKCDESTEYENLINPTPTVPGDRDCRPLTVCNTQLVPQGITPCSNGGTVLYCDNIRVQYISRYPSRTSDRECWTWQPCASHQFMYQHPLSDSEGYLVKSQVCRDYTQCNVVNQYQIVDGTATEDRDNVCATITTCDSATEYELAPPQLLVIPHTDRVCKPKTICDSISHFLLRKGDSTHDNVCAPKTDCRSSSGGTQYEVYPAVDSVDFHTNGTDAICRTYTKCLAGFYANYTGTRNSDVVCAKCSPGSYSTDETSGPCKKCPFGTYQDKQGATTCLQCNPCTSPDNVTDAGLQCPTSPYPVWGGAQVLHAENCTTGIFAPTSTPCKNLRTCV